MPPRIQILIGHREIATAVTALGKRISADFQGREMTVLGVLTGSIVLVTDLMRQITVPHQLGFIQASSYRGTATTSSRLQINMDFLPDIRGRDILLVDDIFDTGRTISGITRQLAERQPRSIRTAVLLWKTARRTVDVTPDYHCFQIPDEFVVGYGLDFDNQYRHLPDIGVIDVGHDSASGHPGNPLQHET